LNFLKIKTCLKYFLFLHLFFFFSYSLKAALARDSKSIEQLIDAEDMPTYADIHRVLRGNFGKNPFMTHPEIASTTGSFDLTGLEKTIAAFAKIHPNGVFIALGRDSFRLEVFIDAFYSFLGQANRTERINASGPTISDSSEVDIIKLVESSGISIGKTRNPVLLFDATGFSSKSQSYKILQSIYNKLSGEGKNAPDVFKQYTFVSTNKGRGNGAVIAFDYSDSLSDYVKNYASSSFPSSILSTSAYSASLAYGKPFWHGTFGSTIKKQISGRIEGTAGTMSSRGTRIQLLAMLVESIKTIQSPSFQTRAKEEFKSFSVNWPSTRTRRVVKKAVPANRQVEKIGDHHLSLESLLGSKIQIGTIIKNKNQKKFKVIKTFKKNKYFSEALVEDLSGEQLTLRIPLSKSKEDQEKFTRWRQRQLKLLDDYAVPVPSVMSGDDSYLLQKSYSGENGKDLLKKFHKGEIDFTHPAMSSLDDLFKKLVDLRLYIGALTPRHMLWTGKEWIILQNGSLSENLARADLDDRYKKSIQSRWKKCAAIFSSLPK